MAEFSEVMKHKKRLCDSGVPCDLCPLSNRNREHENYGCVKYVECFPDEAEEIIMDWAKENPIKTNADKFKEIFGVCACDAFYAKGNNFWNSEYKGNDKIAYEAKKELFMELYQDILEWKESDFQFLLREYMNTDKFKKIKDRYIE